MHYTLDYIINRLNKAIDSDDVYALAAEIELYFKIDDIVLLKKMLKNNSTNNNNFVANTLYVRYLLNYLYEPSEVD